MQNPQFDDAVRILVAALRQVPSIAQGGVNSWAYRDYWAVCCDVPGELNNVKFAVGFCATGHVDDIQRTAVDLRDRVFDSSTIFTLAAPCFSEAARQRCVEQGLAYVDGQGNCRVAFGNVFLHQSVTGLPPVPERRDLKWLFSPRAAQVLTTLLRSPGKAWGTRELARAANVTPGHVINVRETLYAWSWAVTDHEGLRLTAPKALLHEWNVAYSDLLMAPCRPLAAPPRCVIGGASEVV